MNSLQVAIYGFYIIIAGIVGLIVSVVIAISDEERAVRYGKFFIKLACIGFICWLYGNVMFQFR